ncbi:hypothetical protein GIB67_015544 [Kingdonia uniflora]|uniref:X8 domain-containing protein n=1 Tax=Kingdonia uniflora TaxID=39325 RepID=A0A7J7NAA1_9MAGN|nr:hypothetical protein GIB67_014875 [Kingdonia uniflora]KAF6163954.1 hypothetical protein GIB67_015544 [Kingdonia uniflora]
MPDDNLDYGYLWCVAKNNAEDTALQNTTDWACRGGGADCKPIQEGGPYYDRNNIQASTSYAFNDYFIKHKIGPEGSCDFGNITNVYSRNTSYGNCILPLSHYSYSGQARPQLQT